MSSELQQPVIKRILLKLSGEALMGDRDFGVSPEAIERLASEIGELAEHGIEVGLVIGGGNLFRGISPTAKDMTRSTADHMGMLATVMNALALHDALERNGVDARVLSALGIDGIVEPYVRRRALRHLSKGRVVLFAGGTGNPYFTTDTGACLRGIEIGAEVLLKATKVDGVYSADPMVDATATRFDKLTYDEVLQKKLGVMDLTAIVMSRDNNLPVRVFSMNEPKAVLKICYGENRGTLVSTT